MVVSLQVKQAVHEQVRVVGLDRLALAAGLARDDRGADDDVAGERPGGVDEGEHVGGVVLAAVLPVEGLAFLAADDAHRDLRRPIQGHGDPLAHARRTQQRLVHAGAGEGAELQRDLGLRHQPSFLRAAS